MAFALPPEPPRRLVDALERHPDPRITATSADWLAALPGLLTRRLERWDLTPERIVSPGGRSSLVVLVRQADGTPAALKLLGPAGAPPERRARREAGALTRWNGLGAVRLLRAEPADGALLLERLHCEVSLRSLPEAKAVLEAVSAVMRLWVRPDPAAPATPVDGTNAANAGNTADVEDTADRMFPTVAERTGAEVAVLRAHVPEEADALVRQALELRDGLLDSAPEGVLLHGDFRQGTVLSSDAERAPWLVVGPDPVVGEPAYDLARLVRDRLHDLVGSSGAPAAARRRVRRLADSLDLDRDRLRDWSVYRAVESGVRHLASGQPADGGTLLEFATWL
ncbi:kinase [Streptomyces sp. AJS327]|uniref:aminoglycoside phosphotransferase family protein n=1 Tax=Streptomyces sp. AJS327 TaxID=2545265 RepID=UPI0015DEEDA3|nr:aminoglycoside phosphotransferase family protein [Streptomyces sp. AJS327]MBA0051863.1 kinase [Streptomyces sp. AJS327]